MLKSQAAWLGILSLEIMGERLATFILSPGRHAVLRLRDCFAERSSCCAQDDKKLAGWIAPPRMILQKT